MKTTPLVLALLGGALCLSYTSAACAECSCACIEGDPAWVCTGFIESVTTTDECTAALDCATQDAAGTDGPPGFTCRSRNVYDAGTGKYQPQQVCHPRELAEQGAWGKSQGRN